MAEATKPISHLLLREAVAAICRVNRKTGWRSDAAATVS